MQFVKESEKIMNILLKRVLYHFAQEFQHFSKWKDVGSKNDERKRHNFLTKSKRISLSSKVKSETSKNSGDNKKNQILNQMDVYTNHNRTVIFRRFTVSPLKI